MTGKAAKALPKERATRWFSLEEAAKKLSKTNPSDPILPQDLLLWAANGDLQLSVVFAAAIWGEEGELLEPDQPPDASQSSTPDDLDRSEARSDVDFGTAPCDAGAGVPEEAMVNLSEWNEAEDGRVLLHVPVRDDARSEGVIELLSGYRFRRSGKFRLLKGIFELTMAGAEAGWPVQRLDELGHQGAQGEIRGGYCILRDQSGASFLLVEITKTPGGYSMQDRLSGPPVGGGLVVDASCVGEPEEVYAAKLHGKERVNYEVLVGALVELMLGDTPARKPVSVYRSAAMLIEALQANFQGAPGLSDSALEEKFARCRRELKARVVTPGSGQNTPVGVRRKK